MSWLDYCHLSLEFHSRPLNLAQTERKGETNPEDDLPGYL
jgi:hypothetical protein